ncbi:MAG: glycosyltransferase [Akkermansiaceae bacterium]|nr:glycosyltransferase [Akkermansiaceae bacterium]
MTTHPRFAVCIPMANEEAGFDYFIGALRRELDEFPGASVYLVVDEASKDATPRLCETLAREDPRFRYIWAPENKNVVDAYLRGFREAMKDSPDFTSWRWTAEARTTPAPSPLSCAPCAKATNAPLARVTSTVDRWTSSPLKRRLLSKLGSLAARLLLSAR